MRVGEAEIRVVADGAEFDRQMRRMGDTADNQFNRAGNSADRNMRRAEESGRRAGRGMGVAIGAGAGAAVGAMAAFAAGDYFSTAVTGAFDLERGLTEVVNVATGGQIDTGLMADLESAVQVLQTDYGVLAEESIPAMYSAISAGVPPENILSFMEDAAKTGAVNLADLETTVDAMTTATNLFAAQNLESAEIMDIFTAAVNNGKTDLSQLGPVMADFGGAAAGAGIGLDEAAAAMAALTAQGVPTASASTQLRNAINELADPSREVAKLFEEIAGESFIAFIEGGGSVADALAMLADHADDTGVRINDLFSTQEAGAAAATLTTVAGAETMANALADMRGEATLTEDAFENIAATGDFQMAQLRGAFEALQIGVGQALGPIIIELAQQLLPLIQELAPLATEVAGTVVGAFGVVLEALLPLIPPLTDIVADLLPILAELFGTLVDAAGPLLEVLAELLVAVLEPLLPALEPILMIVGELAAAIGTALTPIIEILGAILVWLVEQIIVPYVIPILELLLQWLAQTLVQAVENFGAVLEFVFNAIVTAARWLGDRFDEQMAAIAVLWTLVQQAFQAGYQFIKTRVFDPLASAARAVRDTLAPIWDSVTSKFDGVVEKFRTGVEKVKGFFAGIWDSIKGAYNALAGGWNRINIEIGPFTIPDWVPVYGGRSFHIPDLIPNIPYLQTGGLNLVEGPRMLHPNELVVPLDHPAGADALAAAVARALAAADGGALGAGTTIRVYIGDRELTDIIDVRIDNHEDDTAQRIYTGHGRI